MYKVIIASTASACLLLGACSSQPSAAEPSTSSAKPVAQQTITEPKVEQDAKPLLPALPPEKGSATQKPATVSTSLSAGHYIINTNNYQIINQDHPEEKVLLLTFDDGPTGESTLPLLDALDRHRAKSIWFVNGHQLATKRKDGSIVILPEKEELLKEIHRRGHLIGNHTWWHENLRKLTPERQREEVLSTNQIIEQITGEKPKYFRPPFGAYTDTVLELCQAEGMVSVNWSVGSLDWDASVYKKPHGITHQVLATVHKGGNILFHDRLWTSREMDNILTQLRKEGYQFVLPTEAK